MVNDRKFGFVLDEKRLEEICLRAVEAVHAKGGLFRRGLKIFLPQWNLPKELEKNPLEVETANPLGASRYLWTCAFFERINLSKIIMRNAHRVWHDEGKRWVFDPYQVSERQGLELHNIIKKDFQFNLQGKGEETPAQKYKYNALKLVEEFKGDPRKIISGRTVSQARRSLMEFKGIGTGIANLFIIYLLDRELAIPEDPHNALLKVDVHKGRIPINCDAVQPTNGEVYRDESYVGTMERVYQQVCRDRDLSPSILDAALWIIGSEGCVKQDFSHCRNNCPLFGLCKANSLEDKSTGRYIVYKNGRRVDARKHKDQKMFDFF